MAESNVFVSRFRVVPRRAGTLEVPSIRARLKDRVGRSRPVRVTVRPVPPEGRPAEFLGGVGRFALAGRGEPRSVRVGQELDYRITVTGPAAWGMTGRPELKRFDRLNDRLAHRAPARRGDQRAAVADVRLQAAADPAGRGGAPARVVSPRSTRRRRATSPASRRACPSGWSRSRPSTPPRSRTSAGPAAPRRTGWPRWGGGRPRPGRAACSGAAAAIAWVRRRARKAGQLGGPAAARRFAARVARGLGQARVVDGTATPAGFRLGIAGRETERRCARAFDLALEISSALIRYLEIGIGRPPGALTPDEAGGGRRAVHRVGGARRPGRPDRRPVRRRALSRRARIAGRPRPVPAGRPGSVRSPGRVVVGWAWPSHPGWREWRREGTLATIMAKR